MSDVNFSMRNIKESFFGTLFANMFWNINTNTLNHGEKSFSNWTVVFRNTHITVFLARNRPICFDIGQNKKKKKRNFYQIRLVSLWCGKARILITFFLCENILNWILSLHHLHKSNFIYHFIQKRGIQTKFWGHSKASVFYLFMYVLSKTFQFEKQFVHDSSLSLRMDGWVRVLRPFFEEKLKATVYGPHWSLCLSAEMVYLSEPII